MAKQIAWVVPYNRNSDIVVISSTERGAWYAARRKLREMYGPNFAMLVGYAPPRPATEQEARVAWMENDINKFMGHVQKVCREQRFTVAANDPRREAMIAAFAKLED